MCKESNGSVIRDIYCIRQAGAKPETKRKCWGACNATLTCEELQWDVVAPYKNYPEHACGSGVNVQLDGGYWGRTGPWWSSSTYTFHDKWWG